MGKGFKERIAFEVLAILASLVLLCFITRLWPLIFLVIPGILIAAIRLLFLSAKKEKGSTAPDAPPPEPPRLDTEQDVTSIAFGILQRRVAEHIASRHPAARWVWEYPNTMERFAEGLPISILLNRAGGYGRAGVQCFNLQFRGLAFETAEDVAPEGDMPEGNAGEVHVGAPEPDGGYGNSGAPEHGETVDYALTAFQWVESHLLGLNNRCNDAIAEGMTALLIPACSLPHKDSWQEVCGELTRNGFSETVIQPDGIRVTIPE